MRFNIKWLMDGAVIPEEARPRLDAKLSMGGELFNVIWTQDSGATCTVYCSSRWDLIRHLLRNDVMFTFKLTTQTLDYRMELDHFLQTLTEDELELCCGNIYMGK